MPLNKSTGNMFDFITHTWNPIKGACQHDCIYCYMKRWGEGRLKAPRLVKSELKTDLGENNFIFIGSSIDIFAENIPYDWLCNNVLCIANSYSANGNRYLLQTKNPARYLTLYDDWLNPRHFILSTTIETDLFIPEIMRNSPKPVERAKAMAKLPKEYKRMVTIEPIMKFNLNALIAVVMLFEPEQINIGADSCHKSLPEPTAKEITKLHERLSVFTKVVMKKNLDRILKGE